MYFECTLEEFKQRTAEFLKAIPDCDKDSLENGWKALGLSYINMQEHSPADSTIAVSYLNFAAKRYFYQMLQLEKN